MDNSHIFIGFGPKAKVYKLGPYFAGHISEYTYYPCWKIVFIDYYKTLEKKQATQFRQRTLFCKFEIGKIFKKYLDDS